MQVSPRIVSARVVASAVRTDGPEDLEDQFPGRWSKRRAIHEDLRPLAAAVADATRAAGWWTPGSGETVSAGLVIGIDLHGWGHMERWLESLARQGTDEADTLRPSTFLHALPSTPGSTLGLLFGLESYQATINTACLAGFGALAHAVDQLALGRLERVVVACLSAVEPSVAARLPELLGSAEAAFRLGVALCLDAAPGPEPRVSAAVGWAADDPRLRGATPSETLLADLPSGYRVLAAPSLKAVVCSAQEGVKRTVVHTDPCFGTVGVAWLEACGGRDV